MINSGDIFKFLDSIILILIIGAVSIFWSGCASYCGPNGKSESVFSVKATNGCKFYSPSSNPTEDVPFLLRVETQSREGITVKAVVLSDHESEEVFGVNLARGGVQPVWLHIENQTDTPFSLLFAAMDSDYFPPNEAAYMNHTHFSFSVNKLINQYFQEQAINGFIPPGGTSEGFVYTNIDPGVKFVNVTLYGPKRIESFPFLFEVPGIRTDYQRVDFEKLHSYNEIVDIEDEEELRRALENLPCCTQKKDGSGRNDPINFILIGDPDDIFPALIYRGWDVTEPISFSSGLRAFKSFFSGARYRTSPMSNLFFYKRRQDMGLQKARSTIHERNHLRLWLSPMKYRDKDVWIGAVSRDIGSYFTWRTWWGAAHAIDPDIDEARDYLMQDLVFSQAVSKVGYVDGVGIATQDNPHRNFMNQAYWTDGRRVVFLFGSEPTSLAEIQFFSWEWVDDEETVNFREEMRKMREKYKHESNSR
jgi:hypothetical protein